MRVNVDKQVGREAHYAYLMTFARGQGNDDALACMYASWMAGESILPANWDLSLVIFMSCLVTSASVFQVVELPVLQRPKN